MVNRLITLSIILVVFLAACQSAPANPTEPPEEPVQASPIPTATELPPLPEVSPTPTDDRSLNQAESNCTVVSRQPVPTEQSVVPPVNETDWAQGPEDAKVTIIEYGDFQ